MKMKMKLVDIESPFAGDIEKHVTYCRACMRDSLMRGEYPLASHILYTQDGILDDMDAEERKLGIAAGLGWAIHADLTAVYTDLGVSKGMEEGIRDAEQKGRAIEYRQLDDWK